MRTRTIDGNRTLLIADLASVAEVPEGKFVGGNCYCISYDGCVPDNSMRFTGSGLGMPIPLDWCCIDSDLIKGLDLPSSDSASFLRIAMVAAENGVFCDHSGSAAPSAADSCLTSEISKVSGKLAYFGSMWARSVLSSDGDVDFFVIGSFKPLIVSSNLCWGTKAVFDGYVNAFANLGVNYGEFEYDEYCKSFSTDISRKLLLAECCNADNGYTHVIVIDGLSIPPWVLKSCRLKKILITTEDPHSLDVLRLLHPYYDYVFSNDRNVAEMFGLGYLPVAGDLDRILSLPDDPSYDSDVLFLGAVYPNRLPMVRKIAEVCKEIGVKFKAIGPVYKCNAADLNGVLDNRVVSTNEMLMYQKGASICINLFRDVTSKESSRNIEFFIEGYSMNPRCYDVPICGSLLLTDYRLEIEDVFHNDCVIDIETVSTVLAKYAKDAAARKEMHDKQVKTVREGHLYLHRAIALTALIEKGFLGKSK